MRTSQINGYEVECSGVQSPDGAGWLAFLTVIGPGCNPMHRNRVFPYQQVCVERVFVSEQEAEQAALEEAKKMIKP